MSGQIQCQPQGPEYTQGTLLRLFGNFYDVYNVLIDPSTITLKIRQPDRAIVTYTYDAEIVKDAVGMYHYDYSIIQAGQYFYRWIGTGACQIARELPFNVPASQTIPTTG